MNLILFNVVHICSCKIFNSINLSELRNFEQKNTKNLDSRRKSLVNKIAGEDA